MNRALRSALLAVGSALSADAAVAQVPLGAILEGQIVDSLTGSPIEGVLVRIDSGSETFTDERGEFRLTGLATGRRLFALLTSDCRITWGEIDLIEGIPRTAHLRLPPAFGAAAEEEQRLADERQRTGGRRYEAEEIDRMQVHSVTELIRRVAPGMVGPLSGAPGTTSSIRSGRTRSFVADDPPVVVIDGIRFGNAADALHDLLASQVEVLEVLPGAAAGWEYGSSGAGGVIKITLRRGVATGAATRREAAKCVVPAFPGR